MTVNALVKDETLWMTQMALAELFGCTLENVIMHLKNIYSEQELQDSATTKEFLVVRTEGTRQVSRSIKHYNLDAIIAVGYRVNSRRATQFRIWATSILFNRTQKIISDFDREVKRLLDGDKPDSGKRGK